MRIKEKDKLFLVIDRMINPKCKKNKKIIEDRQQKDRPKFSQKYRAVSKK